MSNELFYADFPWTMTIVVIAIAIIFRLACYLSIRKLDYESRIADLEDGLNEWINRQGNGTTDNPDASDGKASN